MQTILLSRGDLGLGNHTIILTNMLDSRFNATGQLTLETLQVTYEGKAFDIMTPAC